MQRKLGAGGMGAVYIADQPALARTVAIKILKRELAHHAVAVERFRREATIIASLGHPHVVGIHEMGTHSDGTLYIAMEHLDGEDLDARLRRTGPLPCHTALHVVEQIARALAGVHAKGIVHRDLKPANVMLLQVDGVIDFVKVLDFGISKLGTPATGHAPLTDSGVISGTPGFVAPEVIAGGSHDDPRTDLYALGVTWFELVTGRSPFNAATPMAVLLQQLHQDPPRPTAVTPIQLPLEVEDSIMRLMSRDPNARPQSAAELLQLLQQLRQQPNTSPNMMAVVAPAAGVSVMTETMPRLAVVMPSPAHQVRPTWLWVAAMATVAAAAVALAVRQFSVHTPSNAAATAVVSDGDGSDLVAQVPVVPATPVQAPVVQVSVQPVAQMPVLRPRKQVPVLEQATAPPVPEDVAQLQALEQFRQQNLAVLKGCASATKVFGMLRDATATQLPAYRNSVVLQEAVKRCGR